MAFLRLLKGARQRDFSIHESPFTIGRKRGQKVRLPPEEISRNHAEVVLEDGRYYLIDCESHNGTYLNNQKLKPWTRYRLQHDDVIKVCNYIFVFLDEDGSTWREAAADANEQTVDVVETDDETTGVSQPLPSAPDSWEERISINPEAKLRAVMRICEELQQTFSLDEVLTRVLHTLLKLFPEAECALIVFREEEGRRIFPTLVRHRDPTCQDRVTVSGTIIRKVLEQQRALLIFNVSEEPHLQGRDSISIGGLKSLMCAPILDLQGHSLAAVQLDTRTRPHRFTEEDLDLLSMIVRLLSFAIEEARMRITTLEQRTLQRDLEVAREIQLGLLPNAPPEVPGYRFFDFYAPAKQVGGDYYDYLRLPDGRIAVVLGDVSGKGVPAAMLMAKISSELRVFVGSGLSPVEILQRTNATYRDRAPLGSLVTVVVLLLDPRTHELRLANAGHMRPLLVRPGAAAVELGDDEAGCPLGVLDQPEYGCCRLTLEPGDCLVLYTDGVTDSTNEREEWYEVERLRDLLRTARGNATEIGRLIVQDVEDFVGHQPQPDDTCLVCLSREAP